MRVLFVSGEFPPRVGGVGDYTDRLAGALTDQGEAVTVVTSAAQPSPAATNQDAVWATRHEASIRRSVRHWSLAAWRTLAAAIRTERPDVVHLQFQAGAFATHGAITLLPWQLRTWNIRPLLAVTFHDLLPPHLFPLSGRLGIDPAALRWLARGADGVIATNGEDAATLRDWGVRRLRQIPIGSNILPPPGEYDRAASRASLGVGPDAPLLGYFGFTQASKGLEDLLAAFQRLRAAHPGARLLLIGGGTGQPNGTDSGGAEQLRRLANRLGVGDALLWTGYEAAAVVSARLRAVDVLVLPFRDGVSLRRGTLQTALAHGCAIVSTLPRQPIPELAGREALRLVAVGDVPGLATAIAESLEPAAQVRLRAGAQALAQEVSWPAIAAAHRVMYRSLCLPNEG